MKKTNKFLLLFAFLLVAVIACKDEDLEVVPEWETAINTYAKIKDGSSPNFINGNTSSPIDLNFRWISIDGKNTVTKVEFYLIFNESYVDNEGNPKTARHGGTTGKLLKTIEGSAVAASRTDMGVTITQADIFNLYKNNTFNYCGTTVNIFSNPLKPAKTTANPFIAGDALTLKWIAYTEDGRKFDSWSPSVCNEFPGSNCQFAWGVVCTSNLNGPYTYSTVVTAVGPGGVMPSGPLTGSGTLTTVSTGSYTVPDVSFGVYAAVYGDTPAVGCRLSDACDFLSFKGSDQYGDVYSFALVSKTATSMTFDWGNGYGDKARTTITRTDTKTWPASLTSTPSGRCP